MTCTCKSVEITTRHTSLASITLTTNDFSVTDKTMKALGADHNIIKKFYATSSSADAAGASVIFGLKEISKTDPDVTNTVSLAKAIVADTPIDLVGYSPSDNSYAFTEIVAKSTGTIPATFNLTLNLETI